jgi:DNA polymerase/3'-5' exonuclease PolX
MSARREKAISELSAILGIGAITARNMVKMGIYTRAQLAAAVDRGEWRATHLQKIGIMHFDDLHKPIARDTVARISDNIIRIITNESVICSTIAGSYRRGDAVCNDIDILVAISSENDVNEFMDTMHNKLRADHSFVDTASNGEQKITILWRYAWVVSVDIIVIPRINYYAALMYFTGSREYNIYLRKLCAQYDYSLNQYGLYDKLRDNAFIPLQNEEHIFKILDIPWVAPNARRH